MDVADARAEPACVVLGPLLFLTVTIELEADRSRVHLHPGGQGFWIARMIRQLGGDPRLVAPIGGEAGDVVAAVMPGWEIGLEAVPTAATTPTQIHDRRSGEREELVGIDVPELDRHEADDLYGAALKAALAADGVVVTAAPDSVLPDDAYGRFVHDVNAQGIPVFADVHGPALDAIFDAGTLDVLKVSEEDLQQDGWEIDGERDAVDAARQLVGRGAGLVVVSRGGDPAIAAVGDRVVRVHPPTLAEVDHAGAGDSMTAGMSIGRLVGLDPLDAVRLGAAAGAGNVIRRGLGSGSSELIAELARLVEIEDVV
jgi:1-phosphofructokinase